MWPILRNFTLNHLFGGGDRTEDNPYIIRSAGDRVTALYAIWVSGKSADVSSCADLLNGAFTLDSIRRCYALTALKTGPAGAEAAITSQDAGNIDGADITVEDLTEEFYTGIGRAFGNTPEAPRVRKMQTRFRFQPPAGTKVFILLKSLAAIRFCIKKRLSGKCRHM